MLVQLLERKLISVYIYFCVPCGTKMTLEVHVLLESSTAWGLRTIVDEKKVGLCSKSGMCDLDKTSQQVPPRRPHFTFGKMGQMFSSSLVQMGHDSN